MELYNQIIRDLSQTAMLPKDSETTVTTIDAVNQLCGDKFAISFDQGARFANPCFKGHGCSLSKASIVLMFECARFKTWNQVRDLTVSALGYFNGETDELPDNDVRFEAFLPVRANRGRLKCVVLGWEALEAFADMQLKQA